MTDFVSRRRLLTGLAGGCGLSAFAGTRPSAAQSLSLRIIDSAEKLTYAAQRLLIPRTALAPVFRESDISASFRANGSTDPDDPVYQAQARSNFSDWRLVVGGLVETELTLSLADLRALGAQTQITRHDCVEGWSCIGKWTGVQLATVLRRAGLKPAAKFIVFRCADSLEPTLDGSGAESGRYYESIDLIDAFHPQTILAYDMNGQPLQVAYGAPLRLRVERQLGYKMAKYINRIEVVDSFLTIAGGAGGYWEDRGYEWYAGI